MAVDRSHEGESDLSLFGPDPEPEPAPYVPPVRPDQDAPCARCPHPFRAHFGSRGPCIAPYRPGDSATVCPCSEFTPVA